jgi:hypothetical protein
MHGLLVTTGLIASELLIEPYRLVFQLFRKQRLTWGHFISPHHLLFLPQLVPDLWAIFLLAQGRWQMALLAPLSRIGIAVVIYLCLACWIQIRTHKKRHARRGIRKKSSVAHF